MTPALRDLVQFLAELVVDDLRREVPAANDDPTATPEPDDASGDLRTVQH